MMIRSSPVSKLLGVYLYCVSSFSFAPRLRGVGDVEHAEVSTKQV
jgi:hypothetical protein